MTNPPGAACRTTERTPVLRKKRSAKQWIGARSCRLLDMCLFVVIWLIIVAFLKIFNVYIYIYIYLYVYSIYSVFILQILHFIYSYERDGSLPQGLSVAVSGQRPSWAPEAFALLLVMSRIRILWRLYLQPNNGCWVYWLAQRSRK